MGPGLTLLSLFYLGLLPWKPRGWEQLVAPVLSEVFLPSVSLDSVKNLGEKALQMASPRCPSTSFDSAWGGMQSLLFNNRK